MISKTELTFSAANYRRFGHNPITYISSLLHNCISSVPSSAYWPGHFYKCLFQKRRVQPPPGWILSPLSRTNSSPPDRARDTAAEQCSRPNRIVFIAFPGRSQFQRRDFSAMKIERYTIDTTTTDSPSYRILPSPIRWKEGFFEARRKAYPSGAEILFRSLAINAKRLTGQSSGGASPKGVRTPLSTMSTPLLSANVRPL